MVIGITIIIMAAISAGVFQFFSVNTRNTNHMEAVKEVENAVHWITRDVERAQYADNTTYTISHSFAESPLVLNWANEFDNIPGSVTYRQTGSDLVRTYSPNGGPATTNFVAQHVVSDNTSWSLSVSPYGAVLSFNVAARVGSSNPSTETRSFQVVARSKP